MRIYNYPLGEDEILALAAMGVNAPPAVSIADPGELVLSVSNLIQLDATVFDINDDPVGFKWTADGPAAVTFDPANDADQDGLCGDVDNCPNDANPGQEDADGDGCDDCAVGTDGFGPLADNLPANDGLDTDGDGVCDLSDTDIDNDGVLNAADVDPLDPSASTVPV